MAYRKKAYTLKEEITKNGTRYFMVLRTGREIVTN